VITLSESLNSKDIQCMPFLASLDIENIFDPVRKFSKKKKFNLEAFIAIATNRQLFEESLKLDQNIRKAFWAFADNNVMEILSDLYINSQSVQDLIILKNVLLSKKNFCEGFKRDRNRREAEKNLRGR
jgi:hypothetical protein